MTYSCAKCASQGTRPGDCCGQPMGPYEQVNAAALKANGHLAEKLLAAKGQKAPR